MSTVIPRWFSSIPRWFSSIPRWFASIPRWFASIARWFASIARWFASIPRWFASIPRWFASIARWFAVIPKPLKGILNSTITLFYKYKPIDYKSIKTSASQKPTKIKTPNKFFRFNADCSV